MSPRRRVLVYLLAVHVLMALAALPLLARQRPWLIVLELTIAASFGVGSLLIRRLFEAFGVAAEAPLLLGDGDFTVRLRETGQKEIDALVRTYNTLAGRLHEERTRQAEHQQFLAQILRASPAGVVTCDRDGRIDYANPRAAALLGMAENRLLGQRLGQPDGPLGRELAALSDGETRVAALTGGRRLRCSTGEFFDRGCARRFYLIEELTEELRLTERQAYERLVRVIAHEVNNSVTAVRSLVESLAHYSVRLDGEDRADCEGALRIALGRLDQMTGFVASFADVLRLPPPRRRPVALGDLARRVADLLRGESKRCRIEWRLELAEGLGAVAADAVQIEQALLNVCKNALEAIGSDGSITVRLERAGSGQRLTVADSGSGLAPEARAHLFTPFFSTKPGGQGIGLTLVREILEHHGCDYSLDAAPGGPTEFCIHFPEGGPAQNPPAGA